VENNAKQRNRQKRLGGITGHGFLPGTVDLTLEVDGCPSPQNHGDSSRWKDN